MNWVRVGLVSYRTAVVLLLLIIAYELHGLKQASREGARELVLQDIRDRKVTSRDKVLPVYVVNGVRGFEFNGKPKDFNPWVQPLRIEGTGTGAPLQVQESVPMNVSISNQAVRVQIIK
jgi:hypothetical protein